MGIYKHGIKRILDIVMACLMIVVLSPLFLLIIVTYCFSFSFPVFYYQPRIGKGGHVFTLVKFRSLKSNAGADLQQRRFLLGDILRLTSADELPQLFQVLTGRMSLCGPRPLPVQYLPLFSREQHERHTLRPGITGWAQVNGRHSISWESKLNLDVWYVHHLSFALDVKILFMTLVILFSMKKDVSLSEEKFTGAKTKS